MRKRKGFKLRIILGLLVVGSVLITAVVGGYLAISANIRSLTSNYLDNNHQYAKKLASNTTDILNIMQDNMNGLAQLAGESSFSHQELGIWFKANEQYFNSVVITDSDRYIKWMTPDQSYSLKGSQLTSEASIQAIEKRTSFISEPYIAATGRLILLISSPIYDANGQYKGFAGGTIYLQEDNVLSRLLNEHFYDNGSYVYVVDEHARLIFHPDPKRINEQVQSNEVILKVISGKNGSSEIMNSQENSFFAGYAYEPKGGWGIVSQTPVSVLNEPLRKLALNIILQALPVCIIILFIALRVARYIALPLYELARFSEEAVMSKKSVPPQMPKVASLIYEVKQLHQSIGNHLNLLNDEIQIDGLTGLANRKTFDLTLQEWLEDRVSFALVLLDIDFFKRVNDMYGHAVGDEVLKHLAAEMRLTAREQDICFRYGGEEFGILMKIEDIEEPYAIAENLRQRMASSPGPDEIVVTVSMGIALYHPSELITAKELLERADTALYKSKLGGRNRITMYSEEKETIKI
ncbi:sensor domain-containing diguanylate cyclase [Paenibacillus dakarensis]|uniref:sensor domain-containing diguanylate cyclase n=1 Tax=Paenibacillus dakarensis TaxID=1527293 RepID=UPI000AE9F0A3|nr:sensor domain-containing diguanylate cyclase [Paenibacillus dakarensis]